MSYLSVFQSPSDRQLHSPRWQLVYHTGKSVQRIVLLFSVVGLLYAPIALSQELLVPIDTEKKIEKIDEELEIKLHLFPEYRGFRQAFLFQMPDTTYVFEVWYRSNDSTFKIRTMLTPLEAQLFRSRVTTSLRQFAPMTGINQDGRPLLIGNVYTLFLGIYGWGIPYLLGLEGSVAIGSYLLLSAGGILIAQSATERMQISEEAANLSFFGSVMGLAHGAMIHGMLYDKGVTTKGYLGAAMLGSALEGTAGFLVGDRAKLNGGAVEMIGWMSTTGLLYGWGASSLLDLNRVRSISTATFAGSLVGMFSGAALIRNESFTNGDVGVFRGASLVVAYLPISILIAAHVGDSKVYTATAMSAGLLGGGIGYLMVKGKDFTAAEGAYIMFGAFGGMLIGAGIPAIAGASPEVWAVASGLGGLAGFLVMYSNYAPAARVRAGNSAFDFCLHPDGLLAFAQKRTIPIGGTTSFPLASLTYHF
jgi:hypothetical protein